MLGHLVQNREQEAAARDEPGNVRRQKQKIQRGQQQARREMLQDLGFD